MSPFPFAALLPIPKKPEYSQSASHPYFQFHLSTHPYQSHLLPSLPSLPTESSFLAFSKNQ